MAKEDDLGNGIIGCGAVILFFIVIIGLALYWMITLPVIAIIIISIYFKYRDKKHRVKKTKSSRLKGEKKVDWITRMTESANKCREVKIQMIKDNNLDKPKPKSKPIICPNCNMELSVWNKCDLCGWEKEICKREALGEKCFLKTDETSCENCGKYEKWDEKEQGKEKRRRRVPQHVKNEVWRRDEGKCAKCGSRLNLEYDHIIPFSKGGSNTTRNIELLCQKCNRKKFNTI